MDAHVHFWQFNPVRDAWITNDMKVIQRDFLPIEFENHLQKANIEGCIAVQADQSEAETEFLLKLAEEHASIKAVVGWVDLLANDVAERLSHFAQFKKLKGVRHIVQAESAGFMLQESFLNGIKKLKDFGLTYDVLIYENQIQEANEFTQKFDSQPFVIDHIAKPNMKNGVFENWKSQISEFKTQPNVYCKLSGMVTETHWKTWKEEDFYQYIEVVVETFGINRIMYGSDWPVCLLSADYEEVVGIINAYFDTFSATEKSKIMHENAVRFYGV